MSSDEVSQLLARTRANRERVNRHLKDIGESPHPIRSPLKERNAAGISPRPSPSKIKTTYSSRSPVAAKESRFRSRSPSGIRTTTTTTTVTKSGSPEVEVAVEATEDNAGVEKKEETFDREVTERKTTIEDSPVREGNVERIKRTTITEKEEKIHKTQYVKFTEVPNTPGNRDRLKALAVKFSGEDEVKEISMRRDDDDDDEEEEDRAPTPPPRPSPNKRSPTPKRRAPSPPKPWASSSANATPIVTSSLREINSGYDAEEFGVSGRKKRMAALAAKFSNYDASPVKDATAVAAVAATVAANTAVENNLDVTREIDVDEELEAIEESRERHERERRQSRSRSRSPLKKTSPSKDLAHDDDFVRSLRAQGFEESNSKTKLVYDFKRTPQRQVMDEEVSVKNPLLLSSPTRTATEPRATSPFKPHPLQFVSPQVMKASASPSTSPARSRSPVKGSGSRPASPYKPVTNPMQFIASPSKGRQSPSRRPASPVKAATSAENLDTSVSRPPKPVRTWATVEETTDKETKTNMWKVEAKISVGQGQHAPPPAPPPKPKLLGDGPTNSDTASRRSISQKRSMFEGEGEDETVESVDPAMLSMSQRRALFEKNRTAPKPVARFGDAVTPSMLNNGQGVIKSSAAPRLAPTFAARPRPKSPIKLPTQGRELIERALENKASPKRVASPIKELLSSPKRIAAAHISSFEGARQSPTRHSPTRHPRPTASMRSPSPPPPPPPPPPVEDKHYPGVNSLKRIKVSPPRQGQLYPQLVNETSSEDETRPGTAMSEESVATNASEAPSLGAAIKRVASTRTMPAISEDNASTECDADSHCDIDDMLDEAMDDSGSVAFTEEGPTPPKNARRSAVSVGTSATSPTSSADSWEFTTPQAGPSRRPQRDFRTPLVEGMDQASPKGELPQIEGQEGNKLLHTVSFYRKQKANVNVTPLPKVVRSGAMPSTIQEEIESNRESIQQDIRKLQIEAEEQRQRMEQASKALNFCVTQDEFEGSSERVEGERLLLEATHIYSAAASEIRRLSTEGAIGKSTPQRAKQASTSRGAISMSGLSLPLRADFIQMLHAGGDGTVHYFVVLVKYRSRVIASQMLSTLDGISKGRDGTSRLAFPNLINLRDLDFDFQIYVEVFGLQTRKENISHEVKYHIKKEKSMFNLTPMKKMRKQETARHVNPVNAKTIRRPAFGMVGYSVINIDTLKRRAFNLEKVPEYSPLAGGLEMTLTIHSESRVEQRGFLTMFMDVSGYGDWCRRWCRLSGNHLSFWKYPEDESKSELKTETIDLSTCITDEVLLAPRNISSRMNTLMLETRRPKRQGDKEGELNIMTLDRKSGYTTVRHLLSADTRDDRVAWCTVLQKAIDNIRAWDPRAFRPRADSQTSTTTMESAVPSDSVSEAGSSTSTDIW